MTNFASMPVADLIQTQEYRDFIEIMAVYVARGLSFENAASTMLADQQRIVDMKRTDPAARQAVVDAMAGKIWHTVRTKDHAEKARRYGLR